MSAEIAQRLPHEEEAISLLDTVPGMSRRAAEILIAELGTDLSRFPGAKQLASWAGMCPGNAESGGRRLSGRTRKGNRWLRQVLVESAHVAAKTKATYLAAQYRRIAARCSKKRALIAVAHSILVIAYRLIERDEAYQELGADHFDRVQPQRTARRLTERLERLGFEVALLPKVVAVT